MERITVTYPAPIQNTFDTLMHEGFDAYVVGGAVRDVLEEKTPKDWDFTTRAKPEEIMRLFPNSFSDNKFGTIGVPSDLGVIEITPFRKEGKYMDYRHPSEVSFGKTIEEDLARRDFTINAMALSVHGELIDPFGGKADLSAKVIRTVGDPPMRFSEDALRLLRAIRFAVELDFTVEPTTFSAIQANAHLIAHISGERIRDELLKILASPTDRAANGLFLLRDVGLLKLIVPELEQAFYQPQARHHKHDVGTHLVLSLKHCPAKDPIVRLATLLHDIGKPEVAKEDPTTVDPKTGKSLITFYNHEVVGVPIARRILDRFHFPRKDRDRILNLIRWHQFTVDEQITDAAVRRFIQRVGAQNVDDMLDLRIGDRLGGGCREAESWRLKLFKKRIWEVEHPPPTVSDLAIDGHDVMRGLNLKPGPKVGKVLNELFEETIDDPEKNSREYLLQRLKELKDA